MHIIVLLIFFIITLSSLIISFVAVFQILVNNFSDSKIKWIIISLIGIIGPIMYLTKGRQLIIKKSEMNEKISEKFSFKNYYKNLVLNLNNYLKILFVFSISLITLGFLVRVLNLPFLWECKQVGLILFLIFIVLFLKNDIDNRKKLKIKSIWNQILYWLFILIIIFKYSTILIFTNSDAYKIAEEYIKTDKNLRNEFGEITGYTILPKGSFRKKSDENGVIGIANFSFIIKGNKKYKEIDIIIEKNIEETTWKVIEIK